MRIDNYVFVTLRHVPMIDNSSSAIAEILNSANQAFRPLNKARLVGFQTLSLFPYNLIFVI